MKSLVESTFHGSTFQTIIKEFDQSPSDPKLSFHKNHPRICNYIRQEECSIHVMNMQIYSFKLLFNSGTCNYTQFTIQVRNMQYLYSARRYAVRNIQSSYCSCKELYAIMSIKKKLLLLYFDCILVRFQLYKGHRSMEGARHLPN